MPTQPRSIIIKKINKLIFMVCLTLLAACGKNPPDPDSAVNGLRELTVMAAASLTEIFSELAVPFEAENPGVRVEFNFASSQQLAQQLANGARADLFASANPKQMQAAIESGRVNADAADIFAQNRLILVYPIENPAGIATLSDLAKPGIKILVAGSEVPVGQYTLEFLDKASQSGSFGSDFKDKVLANVVSYEASVKAVAVKVGLGEADAGIVYATDLTPVSRLELGSIEIPDELNVIGEYYIAPVRNGDTDLSKRWTEYLRSEAGATILRKFGFQTVQENR